MPSKDKKNTKIQPREKSLKVPFTIYSDLECLLEEIKTCQNDPKKIIYRKKS